MLLLLLLLLPLLLLLLLPPLLLLLLLLPPAAASYASTLAAAAAAAAAAAVAAAAAAVAATAYPHIVICPTAVSQCISQLLSPSTTPPRRVLRLPLRFARATAMAAVSDLDAAFVGVGHVLGGAAAPAADAGASPPAAPAVAAQPKNRRLRRKTSLTADAPQPVLRRPASRVQKIRREVFEKGGDNQSWLASARPANCRQREDGQQAPLRPFAGGVQRIQTGTVQPLQKGSQSPAWDSC